MTDSGIDAVDYGILKCITDHDKVWKKRVHNLVMEHQEKLPHMGDVSVQTIGRRINRMQEDELLESCILSPDDLNRDLIIGYTVTATGAEAIATKREEFLRNEVLHMGEHMLGSSEPVDPALSREALVELICDEFTLPASIRNEILPECDTMELSALLAIYLFRKEVSKFISQTALKRLAAIATAAPQMQNVFGGETMVERLFRAVNAEAADSMLTEIDSLQ